MSRPGRYSASRSGGLGAARRRAASAWKRSSARARSASGGRVSAGERCEGLGRVHLAVGGAALLELEERAVGDDVAVDGIGRPRRPPVDDADAQALLRRDVPQRLHAAQHRGRRLRAAEAQQVGRVAEGAREGALVSESDRRAHAREPPAAHRLDAVGIRAASGRDRGPHDRRYLLGLDAQARARGPCTAEPGGAASVRARPGRPRVPRPARRCRAARRAGPSVPPRSREPCARRARRSTTRPRRPRRTAPPPRRGAAACGGATGSPRADGRRRRRRRARPRPRACRSGRAGARRRRRAPPPAPGNRAARAARASPTTGRRSRAPTIARPRPTLRASVAGTVRPPRPHHAAARPPTKAAAAVAAAEHDHEVAGEDHEVLRARAQLRLQQGRGQRQHQPEHDAAQQAQAPGHVARGGEGRAAPGVAQHEPVEAGVEVAELAQVRAHALDRRSRFVRGHGRDSRRASAVRGNAPSARCGIRSPGWSFCVHAA